MVNAVVNARAARKAASDAMQCLENTKPGPEGGEAEKRLSGIRNRKQNRGRSFAATGLVACTVTAVLVTVRKEAGG
jgi:hypothetical protein